MNAIEIKAYEIGIKEAHEQKKIVPACKSNAMNRLMAEVKNGLLPLIKAYDAGVAYEINRQAKLGFTTRPTQKGRYTMYTVFEVDYNDRCYKIGTAETLKEACALERKALKKSHGEFPTFTSDGKKCVTSNAKPIE